MNKLRILKIAGVLVILVCLLLLFMKSSVEAAKDITGQWEIKIGTSLENKNISLGSFATLSIYRKTDGRLTGKWGSEELSDVKFQSGKLTFVRIDKTRSHVFRDKFKLKLKAGELTGIMDTEMGDYRVSGIRKKLKNPALGQWEINYNNGEGEIIGILMISEKPKGVLVGTWNTEHKEDVISNVLFQDGKLSFTQTRGLDNFKIETNFEGIIEGHKLVGVFKNERDEIRATGERVGSQLIGEWELTEEVLGNIKNTIIRINEDLTGRYIEPDGNEMPIKNLKIAGDIITFVAEIDGKGNLGLIVTCDFQGKLNGDKLEGKFDSKIFMEKKIVERLNSVVTGKKIY